MNATLKEGADSGAEPGPVTTINSAELARKRRHSVIESWLSQSPFYEPFRKVAAPCYHWLAQPTNSIVTVLLVILAPFIALLLLPLFLIMIPVFLFLAVLGSMATTVKTDAESDVHESVTQHFLH